MFRPTRSILIALFVLAISSTTASAQTDSVTLAWAANTEPDLAGYYLYYKIGNPSEPFDGTGASQGDSPIKIPLAQLSDPDNPEYTLTGLDDQAVYYFVLTAYDNESPENESEYSNCVSNAPNHLAADFGTNGLWTYNDSSWMKLSYWDPDSNLSGWSNGLAVDFGPNGLYSYNVSWTKLSSWNPGSMVALEDKLVVDFDSNGLYNYDAGLWKRISSWNPDSMTGWGSNQLAVDFGSNGLYSHNGTAWTKISFWNPDSMTAWGSNQLAVDFGSNGLWSHNGTAWTKISSWNPTSITGWGSSELAVDFGSNGLWSYNGTSWTKLSSLSPDDPNGMEGW